MQISELLLPERIACQRQGSSKKRALEELARLLAGALPDFNDGEIFESLISRERLGSTGLGRGVALPHGRLKGLKAPVAALLTLQQGVDFDAIDGQPVDLLFALLVPDESTDEHLQILARLAEMFSDVDFCRQLRNCRDSAQCHELISRWDSRQQLTA
ncbi:MAG TPA: PTS IIA-like nitrogen-regulatory protein PtsN [Gammaproteobacteria bacterium]|nr:PTS IIA-like nitrogen-regulatory protein PtsN [Gammaproteobacteria bacterium]